MSIYLKPNELKIKNEQGQYVGLNIAAETSVQDYLDAIEAKGLETIDNIPSDYTALSEDVDDLRDDLQQMNLTKFDLSDRMAKGIDDQGNEVLGAIIEGLTENIIVDNNQVLANKALGDYSYASGYNTQALGFGAHAEGKGVKAIGNNSHAEGATSSTIRQLILTGSKNTTTYTFASSFDLEDGTLINNKYILIDNQLYKINNIDFTNHTITFDKTLNATSSFNNVTKDFLLPNLAFGNQSHSEGISTMAIGSVSHAQGAGSIAIGSHSHAEGNFCQAIGNQSHAEGGRTVASGEQSHAEGNRTKAVRYAQHVFGAYNIIDTEGANQTQAGEYIEIVGNGNNTTRSNARTLDWSGNEKIAGSLTLGMGTANETTITAAQLATLVSLASAQGVNF